VEFDPVTVDGRFSRRAQHDVVEQPTSGVKPASEDSGTLPEVVGDGVIDHERTALPLANHPVDSTPLLRLVARDQVLHDQGIGVAYVDPTAVIDHGVTPDHIATDGGSTAEQGDATPETSEESPGVRFDDVVDDLGLTGAQDADPAPSGSAAAW